MSWLINTKNPCCRCTSYSCTRTYARREPRTPRGSLLVLFFFLFFSQVTFCSHKYHVGVAPLSKLCCCSQDLEVFDLKELGHCEEANVEISMLFRLQIRNNQAASLLVQRCRYRVYNMVISIQSLYHCKQLIRVRRCTACARHLLR